MEKTRDPFKKIRDTKGTFHAKMGTIKDRNSMDLTEAVMLKLKLQYFGHLMRIIDSLEKTLMLGAGSGWGQEEKGTTEDEMSMSGWHH